MERARNIDWETEMKEYMESGKTYKEFAESKPYSCSALKNHIYRLSKKTEIVPVVVSRTSQIIVNGWRITVDEHTDERALHTVLLAMRD